MTEAEPTARPTARTVSDTPADTPAERAARSQRRRVYVSSFVGSAIEFYDFLVYATAASLAFGPVFFPQVDERLGLISSFGTLAAGYIARPLGGVVLGHFGDRVGRKSVLILTLVAMGVATVGIGLLPTYGQVGILAPILLVFLRLVQGIAVGGEWAGAVLMSVEHARPRGRGLLGSATQSGSALGMLLSFAAFGAVAGLSQEQFLSWGWRLPFLGTVVLLGLGLYMRLKIEESPVLETARRRDRDRPAGGPPLLAVLRRNPRRLLLALGIDVGPFMMQAVATTFLLSWATSAHGIPRSTLLTGVLVASALMLVTIPAFAALSDRVGRRPVYLTGAVLCVGNAFLLFPLVGTGDPLWILVAFVVTLPLLRAATIGPLGALLSELFPTRQRYTGVSLAYQFAAVVGGGVGPLLAATLVEPGAYDAFGASLLLATASAVSVLCALLVRETRTVDLTEL